MKNELTALQIIKLELSNKSILYSKTKKTAYSLPVGKRAFLLRQCAKIKRSIEQMIKAINEIEQNNLYFKQFEN